MARVIITPINPVEWIMKTINPQIEKAEGAVKNQPPITLTTPDTL